MFYDFAVVVPAGTTQDDPVEQRLKLTAGVIIKADIEFPAGCRGYVYLVVNDDGHQVWPTNPSEQFNTEDFTISMLEIYPVLTEPFELRAIAWSPQTNYDHTITIRIDLIRIEDLVALVPILSGLEKFLQYIGVTPTEKEEVTPPPEEEVTPPPEEEVTPTPPPEEEVTPTPPPEEEVPPVTPAPPAELQIPGKILGVQWGNDSGWHDISEDIPSENSVDGVKALHVKLRFAVENTGEQAGKYKMGLFEKLGAGGYWSYSGIWTISPGQGFIDWLVGTGTTGKYVGIVDSKGNISQIFVPGGPITYTRTYGLFSDSKQVDELTFEATVV
jgi:hypothetical protein